MRHRMPAQVAILLFAALVAASASSAEDYTLQAFTITANAPVAISLGADRTVSEPLYTNAHGEWTPLTVVGEADGGGVQFTLPSDAVGTTTVLLEQPDWLTLPDTDAPVISGCRANDVEYTAENGIVMMGQLAEAPDEIMLTVADPTNPISTEKVQAFINGRPMSTFEGGLDAEHGDEAKTANIFIMPGNLPDDKYEISLLVPDASPSHNSLAARIVFSTAPLLRNAGFNELDKDGKPLNWSFGSWDSGDPSEYEISIAKDQGRSGNALKLVGTSGRLNMVVGQPVDLVAGQTYILSGYYKNTARGGYASLMGTKTTAEKAQYSNTTPLAQADDWTPFAWELTAEEGNNNYMLYLRSTSVGTVYFDDLVLQPKL